MTVSLAEDSRITTYEIDRAAVANECAKGPRTISGAPAFIKRELTRAEAAELLKTARRLDQHARQ